MHYTTLLLSCSLPFFVFAQKQETALLHVTKTKDFTVTGDGTSPAWKTTSWVVLPQREKNTEFAKTTLKLLYTDSGIYCLYYCEDKTITATLTADFDDLYNEDVVEAFFWTDEKVPMYFEYELSPLNFELPIMVPNNKGNFFGWRPWHYEGNRKTRHATQVQKKDNQVVSWTGEFFIPFALLKPLTKIPPQKGTRWRANFYRIDYDQGIRQWSWMPTRVNFHDYERFGTIVFD